MIDEEVKEKAATIGIRTVWVIILALVATILYGVVGLGDPEPVNAVSNSTGVINTSE